jgi:hypothetical protein
MRAWKHSWKERDAANDPDRAMELPSPCIAALIPGIERRANAACQLFFADC